MSNLVLSIRNWHNLGHLNCKFGLELFSACGQKVCIYKPFALKGPFSHHFKANCLDLVPWPKDVNIFIQKTFSLG